MAVRMLLLWIAMMGLTASCLGQQVNNMAANSTSCSSVRSAYRSRGFNDRDAPQQPISGAKLRYCGSRSGGQQQTCCTESMEAKLMEASRQQYEMVLRETTANLLATFTTRAKKFDDFFKELLENSKRDFHDMFKRTYGILYEQNSEVFTDLFRDLEEYYARGKLDLEEAMDHFFTALYQRMFTVLNAQFRFDDKYLVCVNTHMKELKPFGDVPKKLSVQVKRSFVATRTFAQALITGRDVVNKIQSLEPSPECHKAVMRMTTCPTCQGFADLKPCSNLCLNVLKGCLAYHADLGTEWDNYVDALMKVSDRLLGPFNIELVVDPIDIKISDAIMNFQENGYEISQKVFKGCGQPRLGKRSAAEINFESVKFDRGTGAGSAAGSSPSSGSRPAAAAGTSLDRLVREIKQKVKQSRGFWSKIPQTVCTHEKMSSQSTIDGDCWNGNERTRYATALMGDGSAGSVGADLIPADASRPNTLVNEQIFSLRLMTNKLENAYNGMDVEWDDGWVNGGSGSGSGSGDDDDDEDDDENSMEDDDEDHVRPKPNKPTSRPVPANPRQKNRHPESAQPAPPSREDEDEDDIEFSAGNVPVARPDDGRAGSPTTTSSAAPGAEQGAPAVRTKAVTSYLVPIVVMWIGNMF